MEPDTLHFSLATVQVLGGARSCCYLGSKEGWRLESCICPPFLPELEVRVRAKNISCSPGRWMWFKRRVQRG